MPSDKLTHAELRTVIRKLLEQRRDSWTDRPGYIYRGSGDMLLREGHFYPGRPLRKPYNVGLRWCCYRNALEASMADPRLRYCEGVLADESWCGNHAFNVDGYGRVVDFTPDAEGQRPDGSAAYWGIAFEPSLVVDNMQALGAFSVGLLDSPPAVGDFTAAAQFGVAPIEDSRTDFPILTVPYEPRRRHLPRADHTATHSFPRSV